MAALPWITYLQRMVGRGHPTLADTLNTPLRTMLSQSGYDPDAALFPGLPGPVFHVNAFGAIGNGVADDTAAIQSAINAAVAVGGGVVYFPSGTYLISGNGLTFYSSVVLRGTGVFAGGGAQAGPAGASMLYMPSSNATFMFNPSTPAGAIITSTVFDGLCFSIFGNATALGIIDLTNCTGPTVKHCTMSGGTNAAGACIRWLGGPVPGNAGFGTIHHCTFSTVDTFGSVFLFGGSAAGDQPDGISITDCYATVGKTLFKFASDGAAIGGPGSLSVKGCRWEGGSATQPFVAITSDAKGFGGTFVSNRWENTGTTGLTVTLFGVGTSQCAQFFGDSFAPGAGGLTITDNGTIPSVFYGVQRESSNAGSTAINGLSVRARTVTVDTTLNGGDFVVFVDATAANVQISLPAPSSLFLGKPIFRIVKVDASANTVTVHSNPANVQGASNLVMHQQYQSVDLMTDGTNWFVTAASGIALGVNMELKAFSALRWDTGNASFGYLQIDGTPKFILSLNNTTRLQCTTASLSPVSTGGLTLGDSSLSWGDITATGGFRQSLDGWYQENVAASQTDVVMTRLATSTEAPAKWIAPRAGSVTGVWVKANTPRTAGTLTIKVFRNGAQLGTLTAVLDGANTTFKATTLAKDTITFVAGDELETTVTTDAGWLPVTADIRTGLEVET
jgi:hypothetical protein